MGRLRDGLASRLPDSLVGLVKSIRSGDIFQRNARLSFSQEGEDLVLARLFEDQAQGFYVDVGAHHPTRFSNTALLYRRGWSGINIDATPGSMRLFEKHRPRDVNLEVAVSNRPGPLRLHRFNDGALNTVSDELAAERAESPAYEVVELVEVPSLALRDLLREHLPHPTTTIDLLTVDVEGHDLDVLESNDWNNFRPRVVVIEILGSDVEQLDARPEVRLLRDAGYRVFAKLRASVIFTDQEAIAPGP